MSCYIYFYLKRKDTPAKDWHLTLAHLCTSDARELSDELSDFKSGVTYNVNYDRKEEDDPNYGYYTPLTPELLSNTIEYYRSKVQEYKDSKHKYEDELERAQALYVIAKTELALEDIKKTMDDAIEMISWCNEEIAKNEAYAYYIENAVAGVLEENERYDYNKETNTHNAVNDYELIYYMG